MDHSYQDYRSPSYIYIAIETHCKPTQPVSVLHFPILHISTFDRLCSYTKQKELSGANSFKPVKSWKKHIRYTILQNSGSWGCDLASDLITVADILMMCGDHPCWYHVTTRCLEVGILDQWDFTECRIGFYASASVMKLLQRKMFTMQRYLTKYCIIKPQTVLISLHYDQASMLCVWTNE